jgi:hypothetical protein
MDDRPRKTRDEIIRELLVPHRIPPEVLSAADKGLETWRNRSIWNRTTPDIGGNARDHTWLTHHTPPADVCLHYGGASRPRLSTSSVDYRQFNPDLLMPKLHKYIISCLLRMFIGALVILALAVICD